jgi:hypothetical protein
LQHALRQLQGHVRHGPPQRQSATVIPFPCVPPRNATSSERASA